MQLLPTNQAISTDFRAFNAAKDKILLISARIWSEAYHWSTTDLLMAPDEVASCPEAELAMQLHSGTIDYVYCTF